MSRLLYATAAGAFAVLAAACTNTPDKTASNNRTVYHARDTQVGSHIPRSYTDPNESASSTVAGDAGQRSVGTSGVVPSGTR